MRTREDACVHRCTCAPLRRCMGDRLHLRDCATARPCICATVRLLVRASVRLCVCASVRPCVCASVRLCVCATVRPRDCVSMHLCDHSQSCITNSEATPEMVVSTASLSLMFVVVALWLVAPIGSALLQDRRSAPANVCATATLRRRIPNQSCEYQRAQ
jgi:hypothetical protein